MINGIGLKSLDQEGTIYKITSTNNREFKLNPNYGIEKITLSYNYSLS